MSNQTTAADGAFDGGDAGFAWYFDFVSPYAYLQHEVFLQRGLGDLLEYRPVLLGGLLAHWQSKGPAEIESKRRAIYHHCQWLAEEHGIALRFPPAHPFNPLASLRLAVAVLAQGGDGARDCITALFRAVFAEGRDLQGVDAVAEVCGDLWLQLGDAGGEDGVAGVAEAIAQPAVKAQLRANTEEAAADGVFGVPTARIGGQLFWGLDMTEMALEALRDPQRFRRGAYSRLDKLPVGIRRKI